MTQTESQKPNGQKNKKQMLVRYGKMGMLGWFDHNEASIPCVEARVVIKTARGMEIGTIVGPFSYREGRFRYTCQQVEQYHCNRTRDYPLTDGGTFVRFATHDDIVEEKHLAASACEEVQMCSKFVAEMGLSMKVVDAEHLFGGERIVIYFSSVGRVDFRDLVRQLAREYQTRIELRQIGSRDEARLIGDFESCGQECCCRRFLKILEPVNMRMAKLQKATLNPAKISGHCGRLKCCFRYEDETYKQLKSNLPKKGLWVSSPGGQGRIVDSQILTQLVVVQFESGKREAFGVESIEIIDPPQAASGRARPSWANGKKKSANAAIPPKPLPTEEPTATTAHVHDMNNVMDDVDAFEDNGTIVAWDEPDGQPEQVRQDDESQQDDPASPADPVNPARPVSTTGADGEKDNKRPRGKRRGKRRRSRDGRNNRDADKTSNKKTSNGDGKPRADGSTQN